MAVKIGEVESELHAFDATALLTEEVIAVLAVRMAEAMEKEKSETLSRHRDTAVGNNRRSED